MISDKKKIGLTGGIGCGKSTVLNIFKKLNCIIIDTDAICHGLYENSDYLKAELIKHWGNEILDINKIIVRKKIGTIVFNNKNELKWLNNLIHPLIFEEVEKRTTKASSDTNLIIYDVPLLFEVGWEKLFHKVISVWSPVPIQIERLKKRNWPLNEIKSRIISQFPNEIKLSKAHYGIINSGNINLLEKQCNIIYNKLRGNYDKR